MTSREEIVLALKYFFDVETEASVHEIIGQDDDPLGTIAAALDEYRKVDSCEGWIKCSERMPDDKLYVWCWGTYDEWEEPEGFEGYYDATRNKWWAANNGDYVDGGYGGEYQAQVTHWQPLPEPPQESNDDKS